ELMRTVTGDIFLLAVDVRKTADVARMLEQTREKYGSIDHLINNAAGNSSSAAEDLSANRWKSVSEIVLNGTVYCSQAVGKHWIESGNKGAILNMSATYAWDAGAGVIHSSAAKAGVLNMTRTLAVEWGSKYGIRVNAIAPGPIERTDGADKLFESE